MRARRLWCIALLALAAVTHPSAQGALTPPDLTTHPYFVSYGQRSQKERLVRIAALAAAAEKAGDMPRAARHLAGLCIQTSNQTGDVNFTAPPCDRTRKLADELNLLDVKVLLAGSKGVMQGWTFNFAGSVKTLTEAIAMGAAIDPKSPESQPVAGAHNMLGAVSIEMGNFDLAQKELTIGRDHCRAIGSAICAAYADVSLCRLHTMLGDFADARVACDAAAVEGAIDNDLIFQANLGWHRGALDAAVNRPQQSLQNIQAGWDAAQRAGVDILAPILAQQMVDAYMRLGRLDEAEKWQSDIEKGVKEGKVPFFFGPQIAMRRGVLSMARFKLDEAETGFLAASRSLIHEMSIRGFVAAARVNRFRGNNERAADLLQQAINRIESGRTSVAGSALRTSYLTMHWNAYRELIGVKWALGGEEAGPAVLELSEAGRARALLDALASAQVAGATAPTLTAQSVQAMLRPEDVLIEYVSAEDRLSAITVTRDRITLTNLPGAAIQATLARRVEFFSTLAQEADETALAPAAKKLYEDILEPALKNVPASATTLIIAADGPLHGLPFDALGGDSRVIDRWNVVMIPSASALAKRARSGAPTDAALVIAAPATLPNLPPLAAAPAEAAAVRSRIGGNVAELSGKLATKNNLQAERPDRFAVLHFASHALVDEEHPLQSALLLAGDGGNTARWSADEIYRSKLRADLVVLSACSTAAGAQAGGEGVMSLSRAFLHAGAGATIATLWDVPDAPGPVFADVLYRELANGSPLGTAAADARRELRRLGAPPRAWAAYVLTGNPSARVDISARTPMRLVAAQFAGGFAIVLLIGAIGAAFSPAETVRWRPLATASMIVAAAALTLQLWPSRYALSNPESLASRGSSESSLKPFVASTGVVSWPSIKGADEHIVELFDAAGVPVGAAKAQTSPFTIPPASSATWIRVAARKDGASLAESPLLRIQR